MSLLTNLGIAVLLKMDIVVLIDNNAVSTNFYIRSVCILVFKTLVRFSHVLLEEQKEK